MMRSRIALAGAAMGAAWVIGLAAPAAAWDRDVVYADSFGNLVIESAAGYKRIVVGEGADAQRLGGYIGGGYSDGSERVAAAECYRPPVLVKGRSYMYGFDEGEIPLQGGRCR
jgi:hypothetical protein